MGSNLDDAIVYVKADSLNIDKVVRNFFSYSVRDMRRHKLFFNMEGITPMS